MYNASLSAAQIGQKMCLAIHRYKFGKQFETRIGDERFHPGGCQDAIAREAQLDGRCEFRTVNGVDLCIRPIHHRNETRVCAHTLPCLLA